jgi:hypothetical protein
MIVSKFKFGDKVWHDEFGVCIYHHSLGYKNMCRVITERDGSKKVSENNITKVSDWIPCSERMPDIDVPVLVHTGNGMDIDHTYDFGDGVSFYDDLYGEFTHWMPLPEIPEVKE